jgi:hypothetical protein
MMRVSGVDWESEIENNVIREKEREGERERGREGERERGREGGRNLYPPIM